MYKCLFILLALVSFNLNAQTGVWFDRTVVGEGVTVYDHQDFDGNPFRTFFLFTLGGEQCEIVSEEIDVVVSVTATAQAVAECPNSIFPPFKPLCDPVVVDVVQTVTDTVAVTDMSEECNLNAQRWFIATDPVLPKDAGNFLAGDSVGQLLMTEGNDFPTCVPSLEPFEEDVVICHNVTEMGAYILRPQKDGGYHLWVVDPQTDPPSGDPLYNHQYEFTDLLVDPIVIPK